MSKRLEHAIRDMREHLKCNSDWDEQTGPPDDDDALEELEQQCGRLPKSLGGGCQLAGTEFCDWECPFS